MKLNFKTRLTIGICVIAGMFYLQIPSEKSKNNLTNEDLGGIISTVEESFDKAEEKILGSKPDIPDDKPLVPHPDPEKCICKGTGKIVQGDGHVTPCPYHSEDEAKHRCKCDTSKTYCNCEAAYGACQCERTVVTRRRRFFPLFRIFFN